jgi:hypothetical protein
MSHKTNSILTTDVQHFFAERIFVYFILEKQGSSVSS